MAEWIELAVTINRSAAEIISTFLQDLGGQGAVIIDPKDQEDIKAVDYMVWKGPSVPLQAMDTLMVKTYFEDQVDLEDIEYELDEKIDQLKDLDLVQNPVQISIESMNDDHWFDEFDKHYEPIAVSRFLHIQPASKRLSRAATSPIPPVLLDPGIAFGTGQHPTSRLAMLALEYAMAGGEKVLDVGCGSGILSITAKHLGAESVHACDIDDQALTSCRHNLDLNEIEAEVFYSDLLEEVEETYDIILSNIVAKYIICLLDQAKDHLSPQGLMIVSGIIEEKNSRVLTAIDRADFDIVLKLQEEDWLAYVLKASDR